ncbi:hypothetical protein ACU61A_15790 [Pseudonocardia sichuanensis]
MTEPHTGGMIALFPDATTVRQLRVEHADALPADELHCTLVYLGDDVTGWPSDVAQLLVERLEQDLLARAGSSLDARAFAHMTFNADGGPNADLEPCAAYGISDSAELAPLRELAAAVVDRTLPAADVAVPEQHEPFIPHVTAGYGLTAADLTYLGPVRFDRVLVCLGEERVGVRL